MTSAHLISQKQALDNFFTNLYIFQASDPKQLKLAGSVRDERLTALKATGWTEVDGRDAIYKEIMFKDFNEVCILILDRQIMAIFV